METEKKIDEISWTWADQVSSYKFWGIFLFFIILLIPNIIMNYSSLIFKNSFGISTTQLSTTLVFRTFGGFGGFWLAWFLIRLKNHYLLYVYSGFTIIGLLLILLIPSIITLSIGFFLIGLGLGAISLAVPAIIAGGRGGSEMFVVSFGLIAFFESLAWASYSGLFGILLVTLNTPKSCILVGLGASLLGSILLLPVKPDLFNCSPPDRRSTLSPTHRDPFIVMLLCLIPIYNIYYIIYLSYRFHGEVYSINPTRSILSPRAGAWCTVLLSVLSPIITCSLNSSLISRLSDNGKLKYYKNWAIILWSFIFIPISYALIQSNMNKMINNEVNVENTGILST
jgi:hypothetical protein